LKRYDSFETLDQTAVEETPRGLRNIGNSCWINTVIGFLMNKFQGDLPEVMNTAFGSSSNPSLLQLTKLRYELFQSNRFRDWDTINEQFDANVLFGDFITTTPDLETKFRSQILTEKICSKCQTYEEMLVDRPCLLIHPTNDDFRNNLFDEMKEHSCQTCNEIYGVKVTVTPGQYFVVFFNRVNRENDQDFKILSRPTFPEYFSALELVAVGVHEGKHLAQ
jgi:hypothetical protein